jgi:DNA-binding CsgD family transcriptional regulator
VHRYPVSNPDKDAISAARHFEVFSYTGVPVALTDLSGSVLKINTAFARTTSTSTEELVGRPVDSFMHESAKRRIRRCRHDLASGYRNSAWVRVSFAGEATLEPEFDVLMLLLRSHDGAPTYCLDIYRPNPTEPRATSKVTLTRTEFSILQRVADGETNAEIAKRLYFSPNNVAYHVAEMLRKFGARNRAELVSRAYRTCTLGISA